MPADLERLENAVRAARDEARRLFEVYERQRTEEHLTRFKAASQAYHHTARAFWDAYKAWYPSELGYFDASADG